MPLDGLMVLALDRRAWVGAIAQADGWGLEMGSVLDKQHDNVVVTSRRCCVERVPPAAISKIRLLPSCQVPAVRLERLTNQACARVGLVVYCVVVEAGKVFGCLLAKLRSAFECAARDLRLGGKCNRNRSSGETSCSSFVLAEPDLVVVQLVEDVFWMGKISVDDCPATKADVWVGTGSKQVPDEVNVASMSGPDEEMWVGSRERLVDEAGRQQMVDSVHGTEGGRVVDVEMLHNQLEDLLGEHLRRGRHGGQ